MIKVGSHVRVKKSGKAYVVVSIIKDGVLLWCSSSRTNIVHTFEEVEEPKASGTRPLPRTVMSSVVIRPQRFGGGHLRGGLGSGPTTQVELSNQVQGVLHPVNLPPTTDAALGGAQVDGVTIQASPSGVISTAALTLTTGGTIISPVVPINVVVWRAPFAATVTNVLGYVGGASGSVINARKNGALKLLASDLLLTSANTWMDGGAVQNVNMVAGDSLEIMVISLGGFPTEIAVEVQCLRG